MVYLYLHKNLHKSYTSYSKEFKETAIKRLLFNSESASAVAVALGLTSRGMLFNWIRSYKENGYNVVIKQKGRLSREKQRAREAEERKPRASYVYNDFIKEDQEYLKQDKSTKESKFTWRQKLTLLVFGIVFIIMLWGVQQKSWYLTKIAGVFLATGYIFVFISGLSEHEFVKSFVDGIADLLGVALTIGLARTFSIVMEESHPSNTIMNFFSKQVSGMSPLLFIWFMFLVYIVLGFFIQSSSGLAILSMPIMASLANNL